MIWIILFAGLALRLVSLNQSLWFDEGINAVAAKTYSFLDMLTKYAVADFHPPAWFATIWVWGKTFGYGETALRIPSVVFGVVTIYLTYLLGKKLVSQKLGLLAALLLAINPLHIYYSQEARMYALAAMAVAFNMYLLVRIARGEKVNFILFLLSNFFVLLSDYVAYFIFPAQFIFLLLLSRQTLKKWVLALGGAVLLNSLWWPVFLRQLDIGASASAQLPTWKFVNGAFDPKTLPLTFVKFIIGRISIANKVIYAAMLLPLVALFAYLIWRGIKKLNNFSKKFLIIWLSLPLAVATVISFVIPVYSYFRVLYIIPSFVILVAAGILSFKRFRNILLIIVVLIEITSSLLYLLIPNNQREDWKEAVSFLSQKKDAVILFESSGTFPAFDYYAQNQLNAKGALKDFPAKDGSSVEGLEILIQGQKEVYLVDYLVQISDPQRLAAEKLNQLGYIQGDTFDFHGVGFIYQYVKE